MNLSALNLSQPWLIASWSLAALALLLTLRSVDWKQLGQRFPGWVWHCGIAIVTLLWSLKATIDCQFTFHLLGMAWLTLMLGAPLAALGAAVVVLLHTLLHGGAWANVALLWLTLCLPPILLCRLSLYCSQRLLPPHMFVYLLAVSYLGTGMALLVTGLLALLVFTLAGGLAPAAMFDAYTLPLLFLGFGEATLTGMLVTIGVVYRPQWVATFSDALYLKPR